MNAFTPYLCGFLVAALPAALIILALWDDKRRLRARLNGILRAAIRMDEVSEVRPPTISDWLDLRLEIAPNEPV